MFKDKELNGVLLVLFLIGIVGCLYVADMAYEQHVIQLSTNETTTSANSQALNNSTIELCKQYRRWQALPEIKGVTTSMDAVCEKIGH